MSTAPDPPPAGRLSWLVPRVATVLVLALGLFPAVFVTSSGGGSMEMSIEGDGMSSMSWYRLGPGLAYFETQVTDGRAVETVRIGWIAIATVLALAYPMAALVTHRVRALLPPRSARLLLVAVPLVIIGAAVLGGGAVSRMLWGYWFARPSPTSITRHVATPTHVALVDNGDYGAQGNSLAGFRVRSERSISDAVAFDDEANDVVLDGRILAPLLEQGHALEDLPPVDATQLERLRAFLEESDVLPEADPGYVANANWLWGSVLLGRDGTDAPVLLASLTTGEVSNDHRGHVEVALDWPPDGAPTVRDQITFFYDVAGLEWLDWSVVARALGALGGAVFSLVVGILACIPRRVPGAPRTPELAVD